MVYLFLLKELKEKHIITRIERLKQFYFTKRKIQNQNLYLGIIKVIVGKKTIIKLCRSDEISFEL